MSTERLARIGAGRWIWVSTLIVGLMSSACTMQTEAASTSEQPTIQASLSEPRSVAIDTQASRVAMTVGGTWVDGDELLLELTVREGEAVIVGDGEGLELSSLELVFDDLVVGDGTLPPDGAQLSQLRVRLVRETRVDAQWDEHFARGAGSMDIAFGWAITLADHEFEMTDQELDGVNVEIDVMAIDGRLELSLDAQDEGALWSLPPALELRAIEVSLVGRD